MNNIENCADCHKKFSFTERLYSNSNGLWICEDCAIKQIQENDNKDRKIAELEAKLEKSELSLGFACKALIDDLNFGNKHEIEHELELHIKHYKSKAEDWLNDYLNLETKFKQDKISFCIEKLDKVKYYAQHIQGGLIDYIDNQIKEIKGE